MSTSIAPPSGPTVNPSHRAPVPTMVRRAAEVAEAAFAAANNPEGDPLADPVALLAANPAEATPPAPETVPAGQSEAPAAPASSPPGRDQGLEGEGGNWQHRYDSLKGKHDAEMARMSNEIAGLHKVLAAVQAAPPPTPTTPVVVTDLTFAPITDEEKADYGEEFLSVAERAAASKFMPLISELRGQIATLQAGVQGVQTAVATDARAEAMKHLASEVPDWATQDTDPGFLGWLQQTDMMAGVPRQVLLDNALAQNNGPRIAAFFKAYKDMQAPPPPAPALQQNPGPKARTSLESLAAPGRGRTGTPPTGGSPGSGKVYTQSEIAGFYREAARGAYRHNPAEKLRIEMDIVAAAGEGRIVAG